MSVLERCLYWRDVCIGEVSVLERCLRWRGVCVGEVSVLIADLAVPPLF